MGRVVFNDLRRLVASNFISKIGDGVHEFLFIVLVLTATHGNLMDCGLVYFFKFIPYTVIGPFAGWLCDTRSRNRIMISCDASRTIMTLIMSGLLLGWNDPSAIVLAVFGMCMSGVRAIYAPAYSSTITQVVSKEALQGANSQIQIGNELGMILGPLLGAGAKHYFGKFGLVMLIDCLTFATSFVLIRGLHTASQGRAARTALKLKEHLSMVGRFYATLGRWHADPVQWVILYSSSCILVLGGCLTIVIPRFTLHLTSSPEIVGVVMSLISTGTLLGSLFCARVDLKMNEKRLLLMWTLYGALIPVAVLASYSRDLLFVWPLLLGFTGAMIDIGIPTLVQSESQPEQIGQNFSRFTALANTADALSGPLLGVLAGVLGFSGVLLLAGALTVAVAPIWYFARLLFRPAARGRVIESEINRVNGGLI